MSHTVHEYTSSCSDWVKPPISEEVLPVQEGGIAYGLPVVGHGMEGLADGPLLQQITRLHNLCT